WLAGLTGMLAGVGYLGSQKVIYVLALSGLLALAQLYVSRQWSRPRELRRAAALIAGLGVAALVHRYGMALWYAPQPTGALQEKLDLFAWYRQVIGFRVYRAMLPQLAPHIVLGLLL